MRLATPPLLDALTLRLLETRKLKKSLAISTDFPTESQRQTTKYTRETLFKLHSKHPRSLLFQHLTLPAQQTVPLVLTSLSFSNYSALSLLARLLLLQLGIGKALSNECIARAGRDGSRKIALHTSEIMEVTLPMDLKMGFQLYGKAPALFGVTYNVYVKKSV